MRQPDKRAHETQLSSSPGPGRAATFVEACEFLAGRPARRAAAGRPLARELERAPPRSVAPNCARAAQQSPAGRPLVDPSSLSASPVAAAFNRRLARQ